MNINLEAKTYARFNVVVKKAGVGVVKESGWFKNIVLNSGLDRMKVGNWGSHCIVGSGDSAPVVTQTKLDSPFATTTNIINTNVTTGTVDGKPYVGKKVTFRFDVGTATGNIREVCLGWGLNNSWNRALVKNSQGVATEISVKSDEYLEITVEIRFFLAQNISGTIFVQDAIGDPISEHTWSGSGKLLTSNTSQWTTDKVWINPLGVISYPYSTTIVESEDVHKNKSKLSLDINTANGSWEGLMLYVSGLGFTTYELGYDLKFTPSIPKTATEKFEIVVSVSWGRYNAS